MTKENYMHFTNTFKDELTVCINDTCLEMHEIVLICCNTHGKFTKYETCAKLHRFLSLYISHSCTCLILKEMGETDT